MANMKYWPLLASSVILGWLLTAVILFDYVSGGLIVRGQLSSQMQIIVLLVVLVLSYFPVVRTTRLQITQWCSTTALSIYVNNQLGDFGRGLRRWLRHAYISLYLLADVVFCAGGPMLIVTAATGYWLLDDVSFFDLLLYIGVIALILLAGLYSNIVRLLSLGYFFGYWLLSEDLLLYPFVAPKLVYENVELMLSGAPDMFILIVAFFFVGLVLARLFAPFILQLFFCPRRWERFSETRGDSLNRFIIIALAVILIGVVDVMQWINSHLYFAGVAIWFLDGYWQREVAQEPALSTDFRYLLHTSKTAS
jgi:hypothetical protein